MASTTAPAPQAPLPSQEEQAQPSQQLPANQLDPAHHSVDPSLSSIAAFNAAYNSNHETNEWGKRPAEHDLSNDASGLSPADPAAKRQHLDTQQLDEVVPGVDGHGMQNEVVDSHVSQIQDVGSVFANRTGQTSTDGQYEHHHHHEHHSQQQNGLESSSHGIDNDDEDGLDQDFDMDDEEHEHSSAGPAVWNLNFMDPNYMLWDANQNLRIQSLPILDNLSTQILTTLGKGPYQETLNIVTQPDSDQGQAYNTMKSLFDQTKKLYTPEAFLSADELKLDLPEQRATVRKVNLATFVSSVFGSQEVGFFHLNEHFLDTFVPDGGRLLKSQGALYLDLKTQAYISAMSTNERGKEEILTDLFPDEMKEILLLRRPGAKTLTPSEQDFVARLAQRKTHLMMIADDTNLSEKYVWQDFLKEVSWYVSKNYESIVAQPMRRPRKRKPSNAARVHTPQPGEQHQDSPILNQSQLVTPTHPQPPEIDAAAITALTVHNAVHPLPQPPNPSEAVTPAQVALEAELFGSNTSIAMSLGAPPAQPPIPQQSAPTQVLYERARLAATAKASPNARRAGLPSQRRPWSTEEENALMAGLDRVKGPHWSQILAMFGPGGTVNETLKDRNQVQLKDKARNLKLFFLKSGIEVPYYLQFVTGELKTRAPGQAAKNAAKKAVEASADEDAAHVAAVTALGGALGNARMGSQDMGLGNQMMNGSHSQSPPISHEENIQGHEGGLQASVAPTADMGMGIENVIPVFEQAMQHQQQQVQQQQQEMQHQHQHHEQHQLQEQMQQQEQDTLSGFSEGVSAPLDERVDPGLMGVDPALRGSVGHEISAERGTA